MSTRFGKRTVRNLTIITDLILIVAGFGFAYVARYEFQWLEPFVVDVPLSAYRDQWILLSILLVITFTQSRIWTRRRGEFLLDEISRVGYATAVGIALMMAITFLYRPLAFSRLLLIWALIFIIVFIATARLVRRLLLDVLYRRGIGVDKALIVGSGEVGRSVVRTLLARPDLGFKAIGYLDDGSNENNIGSERIPHLGAWKQLDEVLSSEGDVHTVFIALPSHKTKQIEEVMLLSQQHAARARVVPDLFQLSLSKVDFENMAGIPMFRPREILVSQTGQTLKRILDIFIIAILALPAGLITVITALAIKLESPGPAFFFQERVGYKGKTFKMAKFRSMVVDADDMKEALRAMNEADGPIFKIKDDPRLTRVGRMIRRFSLDELPQLYNVLVGDMSMVGPRPPLAEEVSQYQPWHLQRLEVRGGITGLWQVSGRSDLTFDEQCLLDIYYIENWSIAMDLRIMLQTVPHILIGRGAY
jgi:exopolysaccharide biosynthesis polyprenyl glycosylphosphotransferase